MANTQFISKKKLIAALRKIGEAKVTGLISILTGSQRAVLLKFSRGKLIHAFSRSRDISVVIQVLLATEHVKFSFTQVPVEDQPELMPLDTLIEILESGGSLDLELDPTSLPGAVAESNSTNITLEPLKQLLVDIASEYIGLVADIVVEEALENSSDTFEAIDAIAAMIPEADRSAAFRDAVENAINLANE
jgi:hypothetical protein